MPDVNLPSAVDPTHHLPLQFLPSDPTPPAPARSDPPGSTLDWLPDFLDLSWVAYGASSLLVISHFPSPLSDAETVIGPIFRQIYELSGDPSSTVEAVSWSPATPSIGELAAAAENCVWVFSHDSARSKGSFCWSQNAVLVQSTKVEAIRWTGSGDGIIAGGIDVVLWQRNGRSWEIAWKFKADMPQSMVSATWSVEGPFATAAYRSKWQTEGLLTNKASKCVLVCQSVGKSEFLKSELHHPHPVSMIQWRPLGGSLNRDAKHPPRQVLLTCSADGTARLWSEVDDGRGRKVGKDINDHKTMRCSFSVAAVIEINQALNGTLGTDIYLMWATEIGGVHKTSEGAKQIFLGKGYEQDQPGNCEWLIGSGPGMLVNFWAIHCLDDVSPIRFPRVTLWKTQKLQGLKGGLSNYKDGIPLNKVVISRNCLSGPPTLCSFVQLLPCNSLVWSQLYTQTSNNAEDISLNKSGTENILSCSAGGLLNLDGHAGRILQVAVHPYSCEVELAVSLDSCGLLLFWFFSTISNCILGRPTLIPTWELCGKLVTQGSCSKYTSLRWAPSIVNEAVVLLMGHAGGVDCFVVKFQHNEEESIECHYLCTIPFTGHGPYENGPTSIFSIPLPSTCHKTLKSNKFMLLGVWMNGFQALSWEITLHSFDLSRSYCECKFDAGSAPECSMWGFETTFANERYCLNVKPCSSKIPDPHTHDHVSSFAVVCPGRMICIEKSLASTIDRCCPPYILATGCSDGSLKLWRSNMDKPSTPHIPWELVGMLVAHKGPISSICLSDCGRKIATISKELPSNTASTLRIWDSVLLADAGTFMLEDTLSFGQDLVALNWLSCGNGQLLLGACTQNQLQVYSQQRCGGQTLLNSGKLLKKDIWVCIASTRTYPPIYDFFWGPRATAVFVHNSYFCVNSQWLFPINKKHLANADPNCLDYVGRMEEDIDSAVFIDCGLNQFKKILLGDSRRDCKSGIPLEIDLKKDYLSSSLFLARAQLKCGSATKLGLWNMHEVVEKLNGSLPVYHPEALFMNIYSGNWKRAYIALRHLNEFLSSNSSPERKYSPAKYSICVPQIPLSSFFDAHISVYSNDRGFQWSGDASLVTSSSQFQRNLGQFTYSLDSFASSNQLNSSSTETELSDFVEPFQKLYKSAAISDMEKIQILSIIDLLIEMTNSHSGSAYESLDEPGRRFWVALRFQQLHSFRNHGRLASVEELVVDSKLIGWAYHSDCQENLFGSFLPNDPSWQEMRNLGVGFWFTKIAQLRSRMEKLARLQYLKRKDPKDCALLYIALNRIQVLSGLFKVSKDEKDKPLVGFLSRNFQEEKNKAAALKNAYVLMGRHQLELAIAFFLLGGDTSSAVNICAKNLGDEQLALVICRLVEGRGGPLERHLITKFMLPFAIEKDDHWLASLLEWELGNYSQSLIRMLGFQINSATEKHALSSNGVAFSDPNVGLYCLMLATNNCMRNAVGERNIAILGRWAILTTATALNRCGLPLEALEYLSSLPTIPGDTAKRGMSDLGHSENLHAILNPSPRNSFNWLSSNVAFNLEFQAKLDLTLKYLSKLVREHPSWVDIAFGSSEASTCVKEYENHEYVEVLESFQQKLYTAVHLLEQKFSVVPFHLISLILISLQDRGLWFVGFDILHGYTSQHQELDKSQTVDRFLSYALMHKPLLKATRETSLLFSRVIAACSITCSIRKSHYIENNVSGDSRSMRSDSLGYYFQGLTLSLWSLRAALRIAFFSSTEDLTMKPLAIIDLIEYYVQLAYAWHRENSKVLCLLVQPLMITFTNGHTPYEVDMVTLKKLLPQIREVMAQNVSIDNVGLQVSQDRNITHSIPEDERWQIIGACLWQHLSRLMKHKLNMLSNKLDDGCFSVMPDRKHFSRPPSSANLHSDSNSVNELIEPVSLSLVKLLKPTLAHVSSYYVKQLATLLQHKMDYGLHVMTLVWLEESNQSQTRALNQHLNQDIVKLDTMDERHQSDMLWVSCADPKMISESFAKEKINWSHSLDRKPSKGWSNICSRGITTVDETEEIPNHEVSLNSSSASTEAGSPAKSIFRGGHSFLSAWQKDTTLTKEVTPFLNPKEIYKRNGELLEALCLNSIYQRQAALASNRKGILFFNWKDDMPFGDHSDYIWSEADWPLNGWAGSESTPAPTCVSPGVGLGSKKGAHLGLGGATVGVGSLARPGRDLTGGGAFGIPGYAGMGASGLGWETQDDFEELVDPPATVENANTRAFSSHPSRPFFLVGSSNTHIYLWEFGKDKTTATYGVLPAANVPPPYALASISALQFDHCGHRFATAALDGTVCTWQLEVGGRSNIGPTESSLCFNSHASDVAYVTSSGSIIAVAGYSSNNVNVVIWDTLAPPTTSRASILCHEGGARSLSVFDNDIGSGSISPLIVTGGKGGDVGLHDFRYIATGRSKRHRHSDKGEQVMKTSSNIDMHPGNGTKLGQQNQNGMLWYIPKAHSGSVTKISIIPNTSLFLTGSKDGDVKLWDAKRAKLVYHWPKLHERHTFLQPSTRGFGGVVQAAVTDIKVVSHGFLSCGGDGTVKLVQLKDHQRQT